MEVNTMILRRKYLAVAVIHAVAGVTMASSAFAQNAEPQKVEKVEVTGSSIKRIAAEGSLPVQVITRAEIDASGAQSAVDLIQALPSMQGFLAASESVNGGGGGVQNASLHSIGARYTLVLLNGKRLAAYNAGSAVNLASIPLAAVDRVEVLTDGASALYGSDAIAGVVNFILKKRQTDLIIEGTYSAPQASGGKSSNFAISKGFGDIDKQGFNVLLSYSHDEQSELNAKDRPFAKSGIVPFSYQGKPYLLSQLAVNTTPASVTLGLKNEVPGPNGPVSAVTFSPNYLKDGKCAPSTALVTGDLDKACWFDFASTVQLIPKSTRDSVFASGNYKINQDTTLFAEFVHSQFNQKARFAPPAQVIALKLTDPLYAANVLPYLAQLGIDPANVAKASTNNRFVDAGGRSDLYKTRAQHISVGVEGVFKGYDYSVSYVNSQSKRDDFYDGGFLSRNGYNALKAAGKINPFAPSGGNADLFAPLVLHELNDSRKSNLDVLSLRASGEVFKVPGGPAMIGVGADYTKQKYSQLPSAITQGPNVQTGPNTDTVFGAAPGALPIAGRRSNWGTFAELLVPVTKQLEVTGALRYDDYGKVKNAYVFDLDGNLLPEATQGNANSKATYKFSFRFRPLDQVMVRGSIGSGFKVANLDEITQPVADFGVTSGKYPCPVKAPDPRAVNCKGNTQYDLLTGGNALSGPNGLKPEESQNVTLGFRLEPSRNLTLGLDYWSVTMKNQIVALPETFPFENPAAYDALFRTVFDAGQGQNKLSTLLPTFNLGKSRYSGIDWDASFGTDTRIGKLGVTWTGTYMLKSEVEIGGVTESSVGRFDAYNNVTSRVIQRLAFNLRHGGPFGFTHGLAWNWRSGYNDQVQLDSDFTVNAVNPDGSLGDYVTVKRKVAAYSTFDWQTRVDVRKNVAITLGIKNLFDKDPPLSIRTAGGGNQIGYDGRYASALGRQFYVSGSLKF
jgi:iron complex outermembrane recepter protein